MSPEEYKALLSQLDWTNHDQVFRAQAIAAEDVTLTNLYDEASSERNPIDAKEQVRADLIKHGCRVSIRSRKLAGGPKLYFTVEKENLWETGKVVASIIGKHFPEVHMTSGGPSSRTYAEN